MNFDVAVVGMWQQGLLAFNTLVLSGQLGISRALKKDGSLRENIESGRTH